MPIRFYSGVEGSGKTCMMTRDLLLHKRSDGRVLAFPGYELYDDNQKVISETLLPEQWVTLPDELKHQRIAIAIDEVTNFFNHHTWYNKINDMMHSLMAQRRKFATAILMTGPQFYVLPPDIRMMVHEVVHCMDNHTLNHAIKRGLQCVYSKEDTRGMLSRPSQRYSRKKVMPMKQWYPYYDTYASVDAIHQFIKVKFKGREIIIGADGKVASGGYVPFDTAIADAVYKPIEKVDPRIEEVRKMLTYLKKKDANFIEVKTVSSMLPGYKVDGANSLGSILKRFGVKHIAHKRQYDLSEVSI